MNHWIDQWLLYQKRVHAAMNVSRDAGAIVAALLMIADQLDTIAIRVDEK